MKKLLQLSALLMSSCTLFFFGLSAGDNCDPETFVNECLEDNSVPPKGTLHVCEAGVVLAIPCGIDACNADGSSCEQNCGDSIISGSEECDPEDAIDEPCDPQTCQRIPVCGDGETDFPEQCDGAPAGANPCDSACRIIPIQETEPNDDALLFFAQPAITEDIILQGNALIDGDRDAFQITNTGDAPTSVRIDLYDARLGLRQPCPVDFVGSEPLILAQDGARLLLLPPRANTAGQPPDLCGGGELSLEVGESVFMLFAPSKDYLLEIDLGGQLICGDGEVGVGEDCEPPGVGSCDATCKREPACGDGFVDRALEQCDDSNTNNGDGCDQDCRVETTAELEPNDDGNVATGTNDFSAANAQRDVDGQPFRGDVFLQGEILPAGDDDVFAFQNTSNQAASLRLETFDADLGGVGITCNVSNNLRLRDESGALLAQGLARSTGDPCEALTFLLAPNQIVFAQLTSAEDTGEFRYVLSANFEPAPCGDGVKQPAEQCDDGGTQNGDGCDASCRLEGLTPELPNDLNNPQGPFVDDVVISGTVVAPTSGFFLLQNEAASPRLVEIFVSSLEDGLGAPCRNTQIFLSVRDALTNTIIGESASRGQCQGAIILLQPNQRALLKVDPALTVVTGTPYLLSVDFAACGNGDIDFNEDCDGGAGCNAQCQRIAVCGDGFVDAPETCDDGNTQGGDLCSSACQLEFNDGQLEAEPNDPIFGLTPHTTPTPEGPILIGATQLFVGSLNPRRDRDVYLLQNPSNEIQGVALETFHALLGTDQACGDWLDTDIEVFGSFGNRLASDINANDGCAGIQFQLQPQQQAFAVVSAKGAFVPGYLLSVSEGSSLCGDASVEISTTVEACDDGNNLDGDGCSADCQFELGTRETEPNDDGSPSTGGGPGGNDFSAANANGPITEDAIFVGTIDPQGDEDVFAVQNTTTEAVTVRVDTFGRGGLGNPCPGLSGDADTILTIRDSAGNQLAQNDDRGLALADACSGLSFEILAGQTIFVHLAPSIDFLRFPYILTVDFPGACGDGQQDLFVEQCDDGNTVSGDGCSASCQLEFQEGGCEPGQILVRFDASDVPVAIPDNNPTGATSTLNVNDNRIIERVIVTVGSLTHTFTGDLNLSLVSPSGTSFLLAENAGASGDNFIDTSFDDNCQNLLNTGAAPFSGCFKPVVSLTSLQGQPLNGAWRLKAVDTANLDTGSLNAWSIGFCVVGVAVCGDGDFQSGTEQCDDGNLLGGDGCNALCQLEQCGDNIVQAALGENCDDGNLLAGDGCSATCQEEICGNNTLETNEQCDDGNSIDGDGCSASCVIEECGDGIFQPALNEECDDGNTVNNDGCDNDCIHRAELTETEPNDDGSISLGGLGIDGNDFSSTNANGPFSQDTTLFAALSPAGDEDVFAISNPTAATVTVRIDTFSASRGLGVACTSATDTGLNLRDAAGALIVQSDDRGTQDSCSGLTTTLAPNQTIFAHVTEFKDNDPIPGYFVVIDFQ